MDMDFVNAFKEHKVNNNRKGIDIQCGVDLMEVIPNENTHDEANGLCT